jgi:hypothetical protein
VQRRSRHAGARAGYVPGPEYMGHGSASHGSAATAGVYAAAATELGALLCAGIKPWRMSEREPGPLHA